MKKLILLTFVLGVFLTRDLFACDGCSLFFSLTPYDQQSSAGVIFRYRSQAGLSYPIGGASYRVMHSSHGNGAAILPSPVRVRQSFSSAAVNLRLVLPAKFLVMAQLPYRVNTYAEPGMSVTEPGLGDFSFLVGWQGLEWRKRRTGFRITPTVGVKVPTGWQYSSEGKAMDLMDVQGGSGSVDFILDPNWVLRMGDWGFAGDVSYRINGFNSYRIRTANMLNSNAALFRVISLKCGWELLPSANFYMEACDGMYHGEEYIEGTANTLISLGGGVQMVKEGWSFRATTLLPAAQWIDKPQPREKLMAQLEVTRKFDLRKRPVTD